MPQRRSGAVRSRPRKPGAAEAALARRQADAYEALSGQAAHVMRALRGPMEGQMLPANPIEGGEEPASRPRRGQFRELLIQPIFRYASTVEEVRQAIFNLEIGVGYHPAMLWRTMLADDRISACMDTLVSGLLALPCDVVPDEDRDDDKAAAVAALAKRAWPKIFPQGEMATTIKQGLGLGLAFDEKIWAVKQTAGQAPSGLWMPPRMWDLRIKCWDNQWMWWNVGTHTYFLNTDPMGSSPQLDASGATIEIPENGDDHWAIFHPFRGSQGWWDALIRPLSMLWLVRTWAIRDWARFSEVFGMPLVVGYVPEWASAQQRESFIQDLVNMSNEGVAELPVRDSSEAKFDVKLVQATASEGGTNGQAKLLEYLDGCIAIRILGQNLTTNVGSKGGSHAAAKVHENIRGDIIARWAYALEEFIHEQVWVPWALYNFGDAALAPWTRFQAQPPEDLQQKSTVALNVANALDAFQTAGAPVDARKFLDDFGIPLSSEGGDGEHLSAAPGRRRPQLPAGSVRAQAFVDDVADRGRAAMAKLMRGDLRELMAAIRGATTYTEVRDAVLEAYRGLPDPQTRDLIAAGMLLCGLAGRKAVHDEASR